MDYGFEYLFNPEILRRGKEYYRNGAVSSLRRNSDLIEGTVCGSENYDVAVRFSQSGEVDEMYCSCPHASRGRACKHAAALLFAICDTEFSEQIQTLLHKRR